MTIADFATARWRRSSRSEGNGGACVEVAVTGDTAGIRDSKNVPGGMLLFPVSALNGLRRHVT